MKPLLCISLLFLCTSAIAEIDDMPEGATLGDDVSIPVHTVSQTQKDCKITCPDKYDLHIEYEGKDAIIRGCGESFRIECGGGDGR